MFKWMANITMKIHVLITANISTEYCNLIAYKTIHKFHLFKRKEKIRSKITTG